MRYVAMVCGLLALGLLIGVADPASGQDKVKDKVKDKLVGKGATSAVFEVYQDTKKEFRFRLKTNEGMTLAISSRGFKERANLIRIIEEIKLLAGKAKIVEETGPKKK
jgi:uncharacterized protein YegP (UPF0339 family)